MNIVDKALKVINTKEFISMATADKEGTPNSAPKLLLKIDGHIAYFIDYTIGRTAQNLRSNPKISMSFIDLKTFSGYILHGRAEIIESGQIYEECLKDLQRREIQLSVERVIEAVRSDDARKVFELGIPEKFLVYKIEIKEAVEIATSGELKRESLQ
jgi:predicted pyridoxine 5'-phosphate oxidase superfamily flavin-nucleotide-binding protein